MTGAAGALEQAYRDERAAVLAVITRRLDGDLALAEDVVQDAFVAAAVEWDRRGVPDRPGAWLTVTAWRKALDRLRHDRLARARAPDLARDVTYDLEAELDRSSLDDDQLRMLFLTDARRTARVDAEGALVSLEDQDRGRWDAARVREGVAILERALRLGRPGAYLIQAAIQPLHAARAELLRCAGDAAGADTAYAAAIALSGNAAERAALERRRAERDPDG